MKETNPNSSTKEGLIWVVNKTAGDEMIKVRAKRNNYLSADRWRNVMFLYDARFDSGLVFRVATLKYLSTYNTVYWYIKRKQSQAIFRCLTAEYKKR